jgi:hypothetical protein
VTARKPGPPSFEELVVRVDHALRYLEDRIELNRNPLTRLTRVDTLAQRRYPGCVHPRAVALRQIVRQAVDEVVAEVDGEAGLEHVRTFLVLYASGSTVKGASRKLGLSREHCSRTIKKKALLLVAEKFARLAMQRRTLPLPATMPFSRAEREGPHAKVAINLR